MKTLILAMGLAGSALGQQRVVVTGVQAPIPESCKREVQIVAAKLPELGPSEKPWTWVVVCSTKAWDLIVRTAQTEHNTCCAFTILDKGYSYINGVRLLEPLPAVSPGYIIAHERGHCETGSKSEEDADRWARQKGYEWGKKDALKTTSAK